MISIYKIRINNFRTIRDVELDLSDNLLLVGKNASGKTSLLRAISTAFDYSPLSHKDIYMPNASSEELSKNFTVTVTMRSDNKFFKKTERLYFEDYITLEDEYEVFKFTTEFIRHEDGKHYINVKTSNGKKLSKELLNSFIVLYINNVTSLKEDLVTLKKHIHKTHLPSESLEVIKSKLYDNYTEFYESQGANTIIKFAKLKEDLDILKFEYDVNNIPFMSLILVEEPETHIHPQGQRKLFNDLITCYGQQIITTHSPYVLSQAKLENIVITSNKDKNVQVHRIDFDDLGPRSLAKIKQSVIATRGELFFSNLVVLGEGVTEETVLPIYFERYFKRQPFDFGINILGVGGTNFKPFLTLLEKLDIPWYVFSDGEDLPLNSLKNALRGAMGDNYTHIDELDNVIYLEDGLCYEEYLVEQGYIRDIEKAINSVEGRDDTLDLYIKQNNGQLYNDVEVREYDGAEGRLRACKHILVTRKNKTKYAEAIAKSIVVSQDFDHQIPDKVKLLFEKIEEYLKKVGML